ncbi:hypothetical protein [Vibrio nigripulchritudo]|uniref:hypothetical protein n=1 Tax=Vibrio nigripulchritudo TaxID=28173 RepID=UPI0024916F0D|nr:hypothetical protein [Vibrio nigripulchritudo]BDU42894.1 hypothetical protein TUMSATVNIG3_16920 [Vibrio nigripulchritudo]
MIPPLTNSGTMPIHGGNAGPSMAHGQNRSNFGVGSINMGGVPTWAVIAGIAVLSIVALKALK